MLSTEEIKQIARAEIEAEDLRAAIEKYKEKLRKPRFWDRVFPYKIVFIKKES